MYKIIEKEYTEMNNDLLIILLAYLIGSIPFGIIISYCAGYGDIRKIGSGNIGTTNVLRTGNKFIAALTLLADSGKVVIAILIAKKIGFSPDPIAESMASSMNFSSEYFVASIVILGHLFPVWLKFKGGKGVACFLGLSLYLFPLVAIIMICTWIITFIISKYSSLAALTASAVGYIALIITMPMGINLGIILFIITLIALKHKDNISRIHKGTELKFGSK